MEVNVTQAALPALIPAVLLIAGLSAFISPGLRPMWVRVCAQAATLTGFALSLCAAAYLGLSKPYTITLVDDGVIHLLLRIDVVSVTMVTLVCFIGWIVTRYAATYLDGEHRQGAFCGWLLLTLAAVTGLVLSGDLVLLAVSWVATSLFLHQLLLFYAARPNAQRAARKKFLIARLSDVSLVSAVMMLGFAYGTTDIAGILDAVRHGASTPSVSWAAALLALAAILKSAQFPAHGWLIEVMETPTPVSALLHAGVINGGGFLLIRFADIMVGAPAALAGLVLVGGFTAMFGGVVMLTQPAVKTSLAWSTIAQMGFMILECGLGLFPLALLHIVTHSLYKAHSFLASGGAVERIAAARRLGSIAVPSVAAVTRAFVAALVIYAVVGWAFGFLHKSPQALALGVILIFGVAYLFAQGFADAAPKALTVRTAAYAVFTSLSYFILQALAIWLTVGVLPPPPVPGLLEWILISGSVISFGLVALLQSLLPLWVNHPAVAGLRVHVSNGFYLNAIFDRLIGGWNVRKSI